MYQQVITSLRTAYEQKVEERSQAPLSPWKTAARDYFLTLLQQEGKKTLLEVGAGTGHDSLFFQTQGLTVTCTDLTPLMVAHCCAQGLQAEVVDFAQLPKHFAPESFDAVYAVNCLLHVPHADFPSILQGIRTILRPQGLFFLGQYGGEDVEGILESDPYEPKRFFARYSDERIQVIVSQLFEIAEFGSILPTEGGWNFQKMVLRKSGYHG